MRFLPTELPGVVEIEPRVFEDERGFFMETWQRERFAEAGIDAEFVQDSHSRSSHGTLRGLHYQVQQAQGKLVRVIQGEAFDVAVDLRRSSPCFGQWVGRTLSEDNRRLLWIPAGFAHGFLVTGESADFEYRQTDFYAPEHQRAIRWDDPDIGIDWPLAPGQSPLLSDKDGRASAFREADVYE